MPTTTTSARYGAFVVDPGGSSGLAWARLEDTGTVPERLAARTHDGYTTVEGYWERQAVEICRLWRNFLAECREAKIPAYFVMEDFILTRLKSSDREGLYPVWVAAAVVGYRHGTSGVHEIFPSEEERPIVIWQQPSEAKGYAHDERLRRWGLWVPGTAHVHERDARRHLAFFVADEKSSRMRNARKGGLG